MTSDQVILFVGLIIVQAMVVIVVHELGHAIAAKICGWQCVGIGVVGLFIPWDRNVDIKVKFPRWSMTYFTGIAVAFPKDPEKDKKWHYPAYLFGGLIASGAIVVAVVIAAILLKSWIVTVLLIQPLVHMFFTLIPFGGSLATDGTKLKHIVHGGQPAEVERVKFLIETSCIRGVRPHLNEEEYELLTTIRDPYLNYFGWGYMLMEAREAGDTSIATEAESKLTTLLDDHEHLVDVLDLGVRQWTPSDDMSKEALAPSVN